jgi:signal transduction histidine kinase
VLIVDDVPANIRMLNELLQEDHEISAATSGEEALRLAADEPPDLVLLDIVMPGMDGYEVCRRLKDDARTAHVPVIFITAKSAEEDEALGLATGGSDYISKPFSKAIVRARVDSQLRLKREMDRRRELSERLKQANQSLEMMNRNLEQMVEERTAELVEANLRLQELDRMKSAFLSAVSHELRTPLTSVRGFSELLLKDFQKTFYPVGPGRRRSDRKVTKFDKNLKVIVIESKRLHDLINNVIELTALDAGRVDWDMEPLDIYAVVEEALRRTRPMIREKGLTYVEELDTDLPVVVGDRERLVQVLTNLLTNAVKFTDKGSITCKACRDGRELRVSVLDTGRGIPPEEQEQVFQKFRQADDILDGKACGLGLGLPICKAIMEHHGGRIWLESEPGAGSAFHFALPAGG